MISNKFKFTIPFLLLAFLLVFISCEKDPITEVEEEEIVIFEFPHIQYIDSLVYLEIKKTCEDRWDLSLMEETAFVVLSYINEYEIHCTGIMDNKYYSFAITCDLSGKWLSDGKTDYLGRGTFFDIKNIDQLRLDDVRDFWDINSKIDTSYYDGGALYLHPNFLGGKILSDSSANHIGISVFKSKEDALEAMENLREGVNIPTYEGSSDVLSGYWWYFGTANTNGIPNNIYINRWNVLVEIRNVNSVFVANEVSRRMGLLLR